MFCLTTASFGDIIDLCMCLAEKKKKGIESYF